MHKCWPWNRKAKNKKQTQKESTCLTKCICIRRQWFHYCFHLNKDRRWYALSVMEMLFKSTLFMVIMLWRGLLGNSCVEADVCLGHSTDPSTLGVFILIARSSLQVGSVLFPRNIHIHAYVILLQNVSGKTKILMRGWDTLVCGSLLSSQLSAHFMQESCGYCCWNPSPSVLCI